MGEAESYGAQGGARERDKKAVAQARLVWEKVQVALQSREKATLSPAYLVKIVDRLPVEGYLGGLAASFFASYMLDATNHRRMGALTGVMLPIGLVAALFAKILRNRTIRTSSE